MAYAPSVIRITEVKEGVTAGVSIAIGYAPVALTFGLLGETTGLSLTMTVMMSLIVYAGASQYMALNLLSLGTGVFEIIMTTCIVNIRHFLMSASLQGKVADEKPAVKAAYAFGLTDETFSVISATKERPSTGYVIGVCSIAYVSWVVFTAIGFTFGSALPAALQEGMSIALYSMFIGLLVPSMKKETKVIFLAVIAAAFNTVIMMAGMLSSGWSIIIATLLSAVLTEAVLEWKKGGRG